MEKDNIQKHIRAERLDIVEKDGTLRLSLFNGDSMPPALMDGKEILPGHREGQGFGGIMFYNTEGDECGGLIFNSKKNDDRTHENPRNGYFVDI